jgi:uroporphyrinogen decarboxylase
MRQAGRYHAHYQELRRTHSFLDLCKKPEVACEATLGPVRDFGFDAAILFSDLLFPLEAMGMGLRYDEGPKLDWHLRKREDLSRLQGGRELARMMRFQADALRLIRAELPPEKGLLGFVGGPLTLFFYAAVGSHQGELEEARAGLIDGRFDGFNAKLIDLLAENMALQARAGADTIAILDTCAGEISPELYEGAAVPALSEVLKRFRTLCPETPVTYYSKGTSFDHWAKLRDLPIAALGVDWRTDLVQVLERLGDRYVVQGNIDPEWLFLEPNDLEARVREVFGRVKRLGQARLQGWVCGLGHGVLPKTPEDHVRLILRVQKEIFS